MRDLIFEERKYWRIDYQKCLICNRIIQNRIQAVDHVTKYHEVKLNIDESILDFISPV